MQVWRFTKRCYEAALQEDLFSIKTNNPSQDSEPSKTLKILGKELYYVVEADGPRWPKVCTQEVVG